MTPLPVQSLPSQKKFKLPPPPPVQLNCNTDSQNENFFFLHEQIFNFLKGHNLLVTDRPKKISLVCSFCRRGENMFFLIRERLEQKGG